MKSDIQIAKEAKLIKAKDVGEKIGITRSEIQSFGRHMAKVPISLIDQQRVDKSNLILVTAITPTKAGIGKTTLSIGLALGLILGGLLMAAIMLPLNVIFTPMLTGMPKEAVIDMLVPFILPFNLIKAGVNCVVTYILYFVIKPFFNKLIYKR